MPKTSAWVRRRDETVIELATRLDQFRHDLCPRLDVSSEIGGDRHLSLLLRLRVATCARKGCRQAPGPSVATLRVRNLDPGWACGMSASRAARRAIFLSPGSDPVPTGLRRATLVHARRGHHVRYATLLVKLGPAASRESPPRPITGKEYLAAVQDRRSDRSSVIRVEAPRSDRPTQAGPSIFGSPRWRRRSRPRAPTRRPRP